MAGTMIKEVTGGICAPAGYRAAGVHCGFRKKSTKRDLGLIVSDAPANAAAIYTRNKVKGAPIAVCIDHLKNGVAQAVIVNSGNANTCTPDGEAIARETCRLTADALGISESDVIVASTGVIGEKIDIELFRKGIPRVSKKLSYEGSDNIARAIMTTDRIEKQAAVTFKLGGKKVSIGGIAKGSGMINPNMATMLSFITTDAAINSKMLRSALKDDAADTFNQLSVDGDTSTNDTLAILANGLAGNPEIKTKGEDYTTFCAALRKVTVKLVRLLAKDGEGATKLLECAVKNAPSKQAARIVSKAVVQSDLVKTALFGEDANWGRTLCAIGYADAKFSADDISVVLASKKGRVKVCAASRGITFSEEKAAEILAEDEILITVDLNDGDGGATAYGCDLTYGYVRINGSYRT
jgi:glutamate N-acetyltransferase/amino-acid N-acetyltransferase